MPWRRWARESLFWGESPSHQQNKKIMELSTSWIPVRISPLTYLPNSHSFVAEHIKYPDSSKPPAQTNSTVRKSSIAPTGVPPGTSPQNSSVINGERAMSPNAGEPQDPRRAMSPIGAKKPNGMVVQPFPVNGLGSSKPKRPRREVDEDLLGTDDGHGTDATASDSAHRAPSPEQPAARAKSPGSLRAASPGSQGSGDAQQASIAARLQARSPSPNIERTKPPSDAFYGGVRSPTANGFPNVRPGSSTGMVAGSTGNITADLIRDLKTKESEVDAMRNREVWMKATLLKASQSGFVYEDRDEGDWGLVRDEQKIADLVLNFKQFRAKIQVRFYAL